MEPFFLYDEEFNTREKELKKILDFSLKKNYENKNALFLKKLIYSAILHNKPKLIVKPKKQDTINILRKPEVAGLIRSNIHSFQKPLEQKDVLTKLISPQPLKTIQFPQRPKPMVFSQQPVKAKPMPLIKPQPINLNPPTQIPKPEFIPRPTIEKEELQPQISKESLQEVEPQNFETGMQDSNNPIPIIAEPSSLEPNVIRNSDNSLIYNVNEFTIDPKTYRVFYALQNKLFMIIEKSPELIDNQDFFSKNLKETLKLLNMNINEIDTENLKLYLKNYILGFHKIQQLISDNNIKAIYCYGANQPLIIQHQKYGKIQTNLNFNSNTELDDFIKYITKKAGKIVSTSTPSISITFPNGIKFEATIGGDFASSKFILIK